MGWSQSKTVSVLSHHSTSTHLHLLIPLPHTRFFLASFSLPSDRKDFSTWLLRPLQISWWEHFLYCNNPQPPIPKVPFPTLAITLVTKTSLYRILDVFFNLTKALLLVQIIKCKGRHNLGSTWLEVQVFMIRGSNK